MGDRVGRVVEYYIIEGFKWLIDGLDNGELL